MPDFTCIQDLYTHIKNELDAPQNPDKARLWLLFACNTSGKTRLSEAFREENEVPGEDNKIQVLCYNAFFEDYFHWDNEQLILQFDKNSWVAKFIEDEGLEVQIVENLKKLINSKVSPEFDFEDGTISFGYYPGGDNIVPQIKISRAEESLFIWCVFYTILEHAIEILSEKEEERSTDVFNELQYVIIDDPVSSMDDTRIITVALDLLRLVVKSNELENKLKILITTHHCLFYNIIHTRDGRKLGGISRKNYMLSKFDNNRLSLEEQKKDSPFAYHIFLLKEIRKAIDNNNIQKYHFNFFRAILEKTANFLGYLDGWSCLLPENENKRELVQMLNQYSHNNLAEIEVNVLREDEKAIFIEAFNEFFTKFNWSINND